MVIKADISHIGDIIKALEEYERSLDKKLKTLQERLAQIGIDEAKVKFSQAIYDGTNDVDVDKSPRWINENTLRISAEGQSILFIEFGTGITFSEPHPLQSEFPEYQRGEYGNKLGRFSKWRYPIEKGVGTNGQVSATHPDQIETQGNPANRCMYDAGKVMREQIKAIAKEVFNND